MIAKLTLTVSMLIFVLPIAGLAKKPYGEVPDRRALAEVRTYCIEKSGLSDSDRFMVDGFLKTESKPKHLLTKLPWKLVESCQDDSPDAIATMDFVSLTTIGISANGSQPVSRNDAPDPEGEIKLVFTVRDSSQKLLYRGEARPLGGAVPAREDPYSNAPTELPSHGGPAEKVDAVYHVFWRLINDLQVMRGAPAK
jgi:hypothetical protein